jgi:ribosome biogenesis GTPase
VARSILKGRVICAYGQTVDVESAGRVYSCFSRKKADALVVGDWVEFSWDEQTAQGIVQKRLPRHTLLCRSDRYSPVKEMAANVDQILIIFASHPAPNEFHIDEYLVAAELAHIPPALILNKVDLPLSPSVLDLIACYRKIGYPVLEVSAKTETGLVRLSEMLKGKVNFLLGASGVGKSSLLNALTGESSTRIACVSEATQKGQHTTSVSRLYALEEDTFLIDVPGIRELKLPRAQQDKIIQGFPELRSCVGRCRFRNCSHRHDPGCAITEKLQAGEISETRLRNYFRMRDA